ncbi:MAG: GAF domain-containing sensor histidine kinase [Aggregatilineales bacterium]
MNRQLPDYPEETLQDSEAKYRKIFHQIDRGICICQMLFDEDDIPYDYVFLEINAQFESQTGMSNPVGKTARESVPALEDYWVEIYGNVAVSREDVRFEQFAAGLERWFDVYAFPYGQADHYRFCIVFNDITAKKNAEKYSELLLSFTSSLSNVLTEEALTDILIAEGLREFGADGITVALIVDDPTMVEIIGIAGYPEDVSKRWINFPIDHPTLPISYAIRENKALWMRNADERQSLIPQTEGLSAEEQHQSWAILPFHVNNAVNGAIALGFNAPTDFSIGEKNFLLTVTEYYAQALHRARLTETLTHHAASQERQRLSRDLHDSVKQLLFASSTLAQSLPRLWQQSNPRSREYTDDVVNLNRAALAELQTLLLEMRPEAIVATPFTILITNLCNGLRGHKSIEIELVYDGPEKLLLPPDVHVAMYRLTQETLNNVNKHSHASQLLISYGADVDTFHMTISDNGIGFEVEEHGVGFGLHTMREWADSIGATIQIVSEIGEGTHVTVKWGKRNA